MSPRSAKQSLVGKMLFQMLGVLTEFERSLIQEWVRAGLGQARAQGIRLGRPRVPLSMEAAVRKARAVGKGIRRIAHELRLGVGTVKRIVDASQKTWARRRHRWSHRWRFSKGRTASRYD